MMNYTPQSIKANNERLLSLFSLHLNLFERAVDMADVRDIAESCHIPSEHAYAQLLAATWGLDSTGEDRDFFRGWLLPSISCLDKADFEADEYYRTVRLTGGRSGDWELGYESYAAGEAFVCGDLRGYPNGKVLPQIGFFAEEFTFPTVKQSGREWMSVIPNEIVTMKKGINEASGRVLTFGLGLGYYAFHVSRKDEVISVTVVERDESVISLFREHILPFFPDRDKITLIRADAFDYAALHLPGYDYIYTDIWHDPSDGAELYLRMKEYEHLAPEARFGYWCEDTIKYYL
ncbi:MAG: hypothetical protein IJ519_06370 [Clostridia bacterium]|nr:hypothetical protein [Clostridia bacterium]